MDNKTLITLFRKLALLEGVSYLLLAVTMPLKYMLEMPTPNFIVGLAHGVLFILYIGILLVHWVKFKWPFLRVFWLGLASLLPFGTFIVDKRILKPIQKIMPNS